MGINPLSPVFFITEVQVGLFLHSLLTAEDEFLEVMMVFQLSILRNNESYRITTSMEVKYIN